MKRTLIITMATVSILSFGATNVSAKSNIYSHSKSTKIAKKSFRVKHGKLFILKKHGREISFGKRFKIKGKVKSSRKMTIKLNKKKKASTYFYIAKNGHKGWINSIYLKEITKKKTMKNTLAGNNNSSVNNSSNLPTISTTTQSTSITNAKNSAETDTSGTTNSSNQGLRQGSKEQFPVIKDGNTIKVRPSSQTAQKSNSTKKTDDNIYSKNKNRSDSSIEASNKNKIELSKGQIGGVVVSVQNGYGNNPNDRFMSLKPNATVYTLQSEESRTSEYILKANDFAIFKKSIYPVLNTANPQFDQIVLRDAGQVGARLLINENGKLVNYYRFGTNYARVENDFGPYPNAYKFSREGIPAFPESDFLYVKVSDTETYKSRLYQRYGDLN